MFLTKEEEKMASGEYGETIRKSMDILIALGDIYGAEKFVDIKSAQVSGVSYKTIGQAGLEYLEDLARTAEIIYNRADSEKEHMGLTSWKNSPNGKILETDVVIAKNYLYYLMVL